MQPVMTVSLNRTAVQIEEDAHARLSAYLAERVRRARGEVEDANVRAKAAEDLCQLR